MSKLLSIIIPVYNVQDYIEECLGSIFSQNNKSLEIIIVNDGSEDNSEEIILSMISDKENVLYYRQDNKGLSAARNAGINRATGDYITFIDSDDFFSEQAIQIMLTIISSKCPDVIVSKINNFNQNKEVFYDLDFPENNIMKDGISSYVQLASLDRLRSNMAGKIFKRKLLIENEIRFIQGRKYEDLPFFLDVMFKAKSVYFNNYETNMYRLDNTSSIMNGKVNFIDVFENLRFCLNLIDACSIGRSEKRVIERYLFSWSINISFYAINKRLKLYNFNEFQRELFDFVNNDSIHRCAVSSVKYAKLFSKVKVISFLCAKKMTRIIAFLLWVNNV